MEKKIFDTDHRNNPGKTYDDELKEKGTTFNDSPLESDARDRAKMEKTSSPNSQKIDGNNPYADEDTTSDEEMNRERYDDHK